MSYSYIDEKSSDLFVITIENVKKIISFNKEGNLPEDIEEFAVVTEKKIEYGADITMEDLTNLADKDDNGNVR